jgi:addiction module RelE/StbE family toxin
VRLRYTRRALADLDEILEYIAARSPQGAKSVQQRIQALIDLLPASPKIGARTNDPTIRRIVVNPYPYLVFYQPTENEIVIHAIRHAARNPSDMPGR